MRIRFWGTRGSLPKPGPTTLRYGGNTACVEVRTADGTLLVLDCGTGAHELGQALSTPGGPRLRAHLLITHTHWDHIQGFPFFAPLFTRGNEWDIYAPGGLGQKLEATLAGQMEYTYFPVTLGQLGATIRYHDLGEGSFTIGAIRVVAQYLNHPALALGYRLEVGGVTVVYATDHEPHTRDHPMLGTSGGNAAWLVHQEERRHVEFLAGADLVIHDAQYSAAEYADKVGWGHTPVESAVDYALAAGARRLALYHHEPLHDDQSLDALVAACQERVARTGGDLTVFAAAEGQILEFVERVVALPAPARPPPPAENPAGELGRAAIILIADDDPRILGLVTDILQPEGFRLVTAADGETALRLARSERPALILLDWLMPGLDGMDVSRALRDDSDPWLREVPIVLITGQGSPEATGLGFAAGVTDYLTKPFSTGHLRTRVRAWLLRRGRGARGV